MEECLTWTHQGRKELMPGSLLGNAVLSTENQLAFDFGCGQISMNISLVNYLFIGPSDKIKICITFGDSTLF